MYAIRSYYAPETPVGTVWLGWSWPGGERQECFLFAGDRSEVKRQAAEAALLGVLGATREGKARNNFV